MWVHWECQSREMLIDTIWIIIIEILQKRTFEDVLFFCVMKMRFMVGVENQEIEKNPLVIISKRGENWEKSKNTQSEKGEPGKKAENREKKPAREK